MTRRGFRGRLILPRPASIYVPWTETDGLLANGNGAQSPTFGLEGDKTSRERWLKGRWTPGRSLFRAFVLGDHAGRPVEGVSQHVSGFGFGGGTGAIMDREENYVRSR